MALQFSLVTQFVKNNVRNRKHKKQKCLQLRTLSSEHTYVETGELEPVLVESRAHSLYSGTGQAIFFCQNVPVLCYDVLSVGDNVLGIC